MQNVVWQIKPLNAAGVEMFMVMYSPKDGAVYTVGSEKGNSFAAKRADLVAQFLSFVSG